MTIIKGIMCKSIWSKTRGLMFSKKKILIFDMNKEIKINLHMFFVFFKINVYLINKDNKVCEIKENFKPYTLFNSRNKARYVIESPNNLNLKLGEEVYFKKE